MGDLVGIYRGRIEDRTDITPGTKAAHREIPLMPAARALLEKLHAGCQYAASVAVDS